MDGAALLPLNEEYINFIECNSRPGWVMTLAAQILCQAIKDFQRKNKGRTTTDDQRDATEWLNNSEDKYIFDFINICRLFDIDPQVTRIKIVQGIKLPNLCPAGTKIV